MVFFGRCLSMETGLESQVRIIRVLQSYPTCSTNLPSRYQQAIIIKDHPSISLYSTATLPSSLYFRIWFASTSFFQQKSSHSAFSLFIQYCISSKRCIINVQSTLITLARAFDKFVVFCHLKTCTILHACHRACMHLRKLSSDAVGTA